MEGFTRREFLKSTGAATIEGTLRSWGFGIFPSLEKLSSTPETPSNKPELENLVVIGCSSGGKEAIEYLIPKFDLSSSAVVIVPHVNNDEIYDSLSGLGINVVGIEDEVAIREGCVYVVNYKSPSCYLPPTKKVISELGTEDVPDKASTFTIRRGFIKSVYTNPGNSINCAMESAAENYGNSCIGIILSGKGNDGSEGVRCIKYHGGIVLVQIEGNDSDKKPPHLLKYVDEMPKSAQEATKVDFAGPLSGLVTMLKEYLVR